MLADNGRQTVNDDITNYIKNDIKVFKTGAVASITGNKAVVDFNEQGLQPVECIIVRDKSIKTTIKPGDKVEVCFSDLYEGNFFEKNQSKPTSKQLHTLANGVITRIIEPYSKGQSDILIEIDGQLFNIKNDLYSLKQALQDITLLLQAMQTTLQGSLTAWVSTHVPTPATPDAQAQYTQDVANLLTNINILNTNLTRLLK